MRFTVLEALVVAALRQILVLIALPNAGTLKSTASPAVPDASPIPSATPSE
jgi:competence protein ComGC